METRARYLAIGVFTLAVIAAGFAFVFWLYSGGGFRDRTEYRIRFDGQVSGLLVGSGVLFNGINVGEVTDLELSEEDPKQVTATIAVDRTAPIRSDTKVSMDFQGLTGAPVILLTGGSAYATGLIRKEGDIPLLVAEPDAGQSMTQAARNTLQRLDTILSENAEPVRALIANLKTFSDALARNSDKVDNVIAGLERMTGGAAAAGKLPIYTLNAVTGFPPLDKPQRGEIVIPEPSALMSLSSDKILIARDGSVGASIENAQWSDNLPILFQTKLIESFENSKYFATVSRPIMGLEANEQIVTELRDFRIVTEPEPAAVVSYSAKILSGIRLSASRLFEARVPISETDGAAATAGLNAAFDKTVRELVAWTAAHSAAAAPSAITTDAPAADTPSDEMPMLDAP
jgi:phospholipid/cholesterol/gamma-HCH transport system substrate-binding protein